MKKYLLIAATSLIFASCEKKSPEVIVEPEPMTAYESSFVGKWEWYKTETRDASGVLLSIQDTNNTNGYPFENSFIELTSSNYGTEAHRFIQRYGQEPNQGITTKWWIEGTNISCYTFPSPVPSPKLKSILSSSLIIGSNNDNSGTTIYYFKRWAKLSKS